MRYFSLFGDETCNLQIRASFGNAAIWSTKKEKEVIKRYSMIKKE